jgi:hypothetical protein
MAVQNDTNEAEMGCEMSEVSFQTVPVPDRYVLRVYSCITEWTAEDQAAADEEVGAASADEVSRSPNGESWSPPEPAIWSATDLKSLSQDSVKTAQIVTKMLDFLATRPDTFLRSDVLGREINVKVESVTAALRWLNRYFGSRYGRTDRPFTEMRGEYGVTGAQAKAWTDVRQN